MNDRNNITKIDNTNKKSKAKKTSTLEAVLVHKSCRLSMSI
jgi:hypothetical protein